MASLLLAAALLWLLAVSRARAAHGPAAVSRRRTALFLAGVGVLAVALLSPIDAGAATRFSVHMVQHLLLTLVAAPLLVLARPLTLALQAATPAGRGRLLAALRSRPLAALTAPPLAWCGFALVLWGTHFSPLYQAALGNPALHALEHLAYLGTALLFWSAVAAVDPSPARLSPPARILYLLLAMPQMTFLGLAIYSARHALYPAYGLTPAALTDQRLAGALMGGTGMLVVVPAVAVLVLDWLAREERAARRADARLDAAADLRRLAREAPSGGGP
ncbi:MAG TPA: cytochrome c oxidase assembly protein [Actinomycetes bacterium]